MTTDLSNVMLDEVGGSATNLSCVMLGALPYQPGVLIQMEAGYSDASDAVDNSTWDALNEWTTVGQPAFGNDRDDVCFGLQSFPTRSLGKGYLVVEVYCISGSCTELGLQDGQTPHWNNTPYLTLSGSNGGGFSTGQTKTLYGYPKNTTTKDFESLGYFAIETADNTAGDPTRLLRLNKVSWQDATGLEELWNKTTSPQLANGTVTNGVRLT